MKVFKLRHHRHLLLPLYVISLLLVFHTYISAYINSSFLEKFISNKSVGIIYTTGSALSILFFLFVSRVLHKVGNFKLTLSLLFIDLVSLIGMAIADSLKYAIPLFLINIIVVPIIFFNIDIFMEEKIGSKENTTGGSRGLLLTLASLIGAVTPLVSSLLVNEDGVNFSKIYILSAIMLIPVIVLLIKNLKDFEDPKYTEIDVFKAIHNFWKNKNIRNVFLSNFTLQSFFFLMVVYVPIYLTQNMNLSWSEFGIVMFFAQLAYVFLEYPIGIIADKYIGEKEMMSLGFFILIVSLSWMSFLNTDSIFVWSVVMFVSRVGASLVEATTESYFFKQTKSNDAQIISFFRITRPMSYIVGSLMASLSLLYLPFNFLFIVFSILSVPALFFTANIIDTK